MNLVIDNGNFSAKVGVFEDSELRTKNQFTSRDDLYSFLDQNVFDHVIVSSVNQNDDTLLSRIRCEGKKISLAFGLPLPIKIDYATPATLGVDRIAAACGSLDVAPHRHRLVIDAGTCINYEFIDEENVYHGGAISPGVKMRFEAMHQFTARLPLVSAEKKTTVTGNSTEACLQSGVVNGITFEMTGFINHYKEIYPSVGVILCGGDAFLFENTLKHAIFVAPDLVLRGLNRILLHNAPY
jgi:type III pantothenate kinase